ncbi:hypothetical protein [Chitinophaga niabensis]|uniref:hypothetical protein n=1 Tax=Chitinophaga niabensis TaxID=536979 RepID=UPI00190EAB43|nr:hypothetical protein [Chitinophaga niabensis]
MLKIFTPPGNSMRTWDSPFPGWDENAAKLNIYNDIRDILKHLKTTGTGFVSEADESTTGPASFTTTALMVILSF